MNRHAQRRQRLLEELLRAEPVPEQQCAAFVTCDLPTVHYLTGFTGSNATLLVAQQETTLITDGRYRDQATSQTEGVSVRIERDAMSAVVQLTRGPVCVDPSLPIVDVDHLRGAGIDLRVADDSLMQLRQVKDPQELALLAKACAITAQALGALVESISVGDTEVLIARRLETLFAEFGADDRAFPTIVASGPHSAIPHHQPTTTPVQPGDLLIIDCGAMVDGYHADMTRTFIVAADPQPWQREIHRVVLAAQQAGIAAAVPGATARNVDAAARSVIAAAGFGDAFIHGTGHGVGLRIHEPPMVLATSADTISADSPITIEPGIYLPGRGGVRIEDTLVVTDTTRVLTDAPRDLIVVG